MRARDVVRPAARMADELAARAGHDVDKGLAGYDDQSRTRISAGNVAAAR